VSSDDRASPLNTFTALGNYSNKGKTRGALKHSRTCIYSGVRMVPILYNY